MRPALVDARMYGHTCPVATTNKAQQFCPIKTRPISLLLHSLLIVYLAYTMPLIKHPLYCNLRRNGRSFHTTSFRLKRVFVSPEICPNSNTEHQQNTTSSWEGWKERI